jgi:hypothetical protein
MAESAINTFVAPLAAAGLWDFPFPPKGLLQRSLSWARQHRIPPHPLPPEVILHQLLGKTGRHSLYLDSEGAWILHPDSKPPEFLSILPQVLDAVAAGLPPDAQKGYGNIRLRHWEEYLGASLPE